MPALQEADVTPPVTIARLRGCARCHSEHEDIAFEPLQHPIGQYTHWAPCPTNGQPILLTLSRLPEPDSRDPENGDKG